MKITTGKFLPQSDRKHEVNATMIPSVIGIDMLRIRHGAAFIFAAASLAGQDVATTGCRPAAGQEGFFADKQRLELASQGPRLGTLAAEFQGKRGQHPGDGRYLYLYGLSLMGKDTREALTQLYQASSALPSLPWTYKSLADIYASRNFYDPAKLLEQMRRYHRLCPDNLDGYQYLDKVTRVEEARKLAGELRTLLRGRSEPSDGRYWRLLWGAEFRTASEADYPKLREQVASDVKLLEPVAAGGNRNALVALRDGYELTGHTDDAARIGRRLNPDAEADKEYETWITKTGIRTRGDVTPDERARFNVDYAKAAAEWVKQWPDSESAWEFRLVALAGVPDSSKQDIEEAGLEVLRLDASPDRGWTHSPMKLLVAQNWLRKGVRPGDCVLMAEESLAQILRGPADPNDMSGAPGTRASSFDTAVWDAMTAIADGELQLRDLDKTRLALRQMQQWLDHNRAKMADSSVYKRFHGRYLHWEGALAEAQGRKGDAISFYVESTLAGWRDPEAINHARELWSQTGGTDEGWAALMRRPPAASSAAPQSAPPAVEAKIFAPWRDFGKLLPEMSLRDEHGKTWTVTDFKDRSTLLSVWATWCAPCWDELPHLQKLYESIEDRKDIQLVTLSIDQNPGEIEPFMASKHYTFPVLMLGLPYVEQFIGPVTIPRNWIVDTRGVVKHESIGFDLRIANWSGEMIRRLEAVR